MITQTKEYEHHHGSQTVMALSAERLITREIRQASSPTMRGHFGCIFKDTEEYTTGVW